MPAHSKPKHVTFSQTDTWLRAPDCTRSTPTNLSSTAPRQRLKEQISKLEQEFDKTQRSREAYERTYEKMHDMRRKTEQARMMAFVEGCRTREAVLRDSLNDALDTLAMAQHDDKLQSRGYAKSYVDRMEAWRTSVAREHANRR